MSDLSYAGQYTLDSIDVLQPNGKAIDIKQQLVQLTLYEDIFSHFQSGNLVITDTYDLPNLFLNAGVDLLRVKVYTPSIDQKFYINKLFHIYKIDERVETGNRKLSYIVHFITVDSLIDSTRRISKTYKDTPTNIIHNMLVDELNTTTPYIISNTKNTIEYTSNLWSPTQNISYAVEHALGEDGLPSFMFYENRAGFQFKQLTDFANKSFPLLQSFSSDDHNSDVSSGDTADIGNKIKNLNRDYREILDLDQPLYYDYYKDQRTGMLNNRLQYYDLVTKTRIDKTFDMNMDSHSRLNPNRFYTRDTITNSYNNDGVISMHSQGHYGLYTGTTDVTNNVYKQMRLSLLRQFQQHMIRITVFGRTDYTVGSKVYVSSNKMRQFSKSSTEQEIADNYISGNYIISALHHRFSRDGKHECRMELITDSISGGKQ